MTFITLYIRSYDICSFCLDFCFFFFNFSFSFIFIVIYYFAYMNECAKHQVWQSYTHTCICFCQGMCVRLSQPCICHHQTSMDRCCWCCCCRMMQMRIWTRTSAHCSLAIFFLICVFVFYSLFHIFIPLCPLIFHFPFSLFLFSCFPSHYSTGLLMKYWASTRWVLSSFVW